LTKSSGLAPPLGMIKFVTVIAINLATLIVLHKSDFDTQQTGLIPSVRFVEQKFVKQMLMLNSSFRCDQIYKYGYTLLCYLSQAK
jgi:hypothetical protein